MFRFLGFLLGKGILKLIEYLLKPFSVTEEEIKVS
jgi:hypothetical protein